MLEPAGQRDEECSQVLHDVWMFLDDEMDPVARAAVQAHLDGCSPCLAEAGLDYKLKALLHDKCGGERAPETLRARLVATLRSMTITAGGQTIRATELTVDYRDNPLDV